MWKYINAAIIVTLYGIWRMFSKEEEFRSRTLALSAALSLAITILVFPYYHLDDDLPIAVIEAIRAGLSGIAMGVDGDIPYSLEMNRSQFLTYRAFLYFLYVIGPLAGSMFLFSFSSTVRTLFSFIGKKRFHVFSSLNDQTMLIARSIIEENVGGMLIFCSCEEADDYLKNNAKRMNALCLNSAISEFRLRKNRKYEFYILEEDDHESVVTASGFCDMLRNHRNYRSENVIVRIFTGDRQRELILNLDRQYADQVYLRHIDEDSSLAIEGMFLSMDEVVRKKNCRAAIVSDSLSAIEFLKDLLCLAISPESRPVVSLVGPKASQIYDELRKQAPEASCFNVIVNQCPYGKEDEAFRSLEDQDLIFIHYEEDERAYETAARLKRELSSRSGDLRCPKIYCRIRNDDLHKIIREDNIILFGDDRSFYTYSKLINPRLEEAAKRVHLSYLSTKDDELKDEEKILESSGFFRYQNQEASFAEALALYFKQRYILSFREDETIPDADFVESWLADEKNLQRMADAEHDRWNAYERLHGWRHADEKQVAAIIRKYEGKRANDPQLKLHPAIVENDELFECEQKVNELLMEYGSDYRVYYVDADKAIIKKINYILEGKK